MTQNEFASSMKDLCGATRLTEREVQACYNAYWKAFADFDAEDFARAVELWLDANPHFPSIAELKGYIPNYASDKRIAEGIFLMLRKDAEFGQVHYSPGGCIPKMNRCRPEDVAVLNQVGGIDRLMNALNNPENMGHLSRDFVRAYLASGQAPEVRKMLPARLGGDDAVQFLGSGSFNKALPEPGTAECPYCRGKGVKKAENEVSTTFRCFDCKQMFVIGK